ncbi:MAG: hypothetical protein H6834_09975 [Planctomycetes bacterium]|nr:hypothetical protein [Planctomycetota bacterium]
MRSRLVRLLPLTLVLLAALAGLWFATMPAPTTTTAPLGNPLSLGESAPRDTQDPGFHVAPRSGTTTRDVGTTPESEREPQASPRLAQLPPLILTGCCVDASGRVQRNVEVTWCDEHDVRIATRSDARGWFHLRFPPGVPERPSQGSVRLHANAIGSAFELTLNPWDRGTLELGLLPLSPLGSLAIEVRSDRDDEGARRATVVLYREDMARFETAVSGEDGTAVFTGVPTGRYQVVAHRPGERGETAASVRSPGTDVSIARITLRETRTIALDFPEALDRLPDLDAFTLRAPTSRLRIAPLAWGRPYAFVRWERVAGTNRVLLHELGAFDRPRLFLLDWNQRLTDELGQGGLPLRTGTEDMPVELDSTRTWRWKIELGDAAPRDGEPIVLVPLQRAPCPLEFHGVVRNGDLACVGFEPAADWSALAVSTQDAFARLDATFGNVAFHELPVIEVHVRNQRGEPRAGVLVRVTAQGEDTPQATARSDADGVATLSVLPRGPLSVTLQPEETPDARAVRVGEVPTPNGRHVLHATLPSPATVRLRLRDDRELIVPPDDLALRAQGAVVEGIERNTEERSIHFTLRSLTPGLDRVTLRIEVEGYLPATIELDPLARSLQDVEVPLSRGGKVLVHVLPPPDGAVELRLQRENPARGVWLSTRTRFEEREDDAYFAEQLPAGTYRIQDELTRNATAAFVLGGGSAFLEATFDLSQAGWVEGRVDLPAGQSAQRASILVTDLAGNYLKRERVDRRGGFQVRVDGRTPVRLQVEHPELATATPGGTIEVHEPRKDVRLKLENR